MERSLMKNNLTGLQVIYRREKLFMEEEQIKKNLFIEPTILTDVSLDASGDER